MKKFGFAFVGISILVFASCYVPSPLYGTWADNDGNKIIFMTDGTFSATVKVSDSETPSISSGSYIVIDNIVTFTFDNGTVRNTEWDIRGSILYIRWTEGKVVKELVLYHTAK